MQVWDQQDLELGEVQDQARRLYCPMLAVPSRAGSSLEAAVHAAVEVLQPQQVQMMPVLSHGARTQAWVFALHLCSGQLWVMLRPIQHLSCCAA